MKLANIFAFGFVLPQAVVHASLSLVTDSNGNKCVTGTGTGAEVTNFCDTTPGISCCEGQYACEWTSPVTVTKLCHDSCMGEGACFFLSNSIPNPIVIGTGSCKEGYACKFSAGAIGDGSCCGVHSCYSAGGEIEGGSCNGVRACNDIGGDVGRGSCSDEKACEAITRDVGAGSCNTEEACPYSAAVGCNVATCSDDCPTIGSCPTNLPTISPTGSPYVPEESPQYETAGATGDPHFKTLSGHTYDFHGSCDLVLLQAPEFAHGLGLDIHIRTKSRYQYSYIESAAVKMGDDILEVGGWGENFFNGVDGTRYPKTMGGFAIVTHEYQSKKIQRFEIALDHHTKIVMRAFKDLVSVTVEKSSLVLFQNSVGMLGGASGQMLARDGTTLMKSEPNAFGKEWQVKDTEPKLFQNMDRFPQYPEACVMPSANASMQSRRLGGVTVSENDALEACNKEGRMKDLDECVYDILATGDLELAQAGGF